MTPSTPPPPSPSDRSASLAVAAPDVHGLAEGPVWDAARRRLLWVDIVRGIVHEGELDGVSIRPTVEHRFDGMVGAVAVVDDGTLLVAAQEELVTVAPDGRREVIARVVPAGEGRRCNDGSVDPAGRFLVGTLAIDGGSEREVLVRLEPDGTVTTIDDDLTLSNGLAWSADGRRMYSVDSDRRTVFVRDYDPDTGTCDGRRVHLTLDDGYPDGIALDAEEHLWIAVWGAAEARRFAPDGSLVERRATGAPHTSCVAFAGHDLRTLVVTTATDQLTPEQLDAHPDSGKLFTGRVDVPGIPVPTWRPGS